MTDGENLLARAVEVALARRGICESGGRNRGPEMDRYALQIGLTDLAKGYSWCTSGLYDVFLTASRALGIKCPFPKTAKAVRVFELLYKLCYEPNPGIGYVYILDHGTPGDVLTEWKNDRYTDDGHCGIVTALDDVGAPYEVSGNTNAAGSREGNQWAEHHGYPEVSHGGTLLGYLNLGRLVPIISS